MTINYHHSIMDGRTIDNYMKKDPQLARIYHGIYAEDQLPQHDKIESYPVLLIANCDPSYMAGSHWVAFFLQDGRPYGEFFDSYGQKPSYYSKNFDNFLREETWNYSANDKALQSLNSDVCGYYVIFYSIWKSRNYSMDQIVKMFSNFKSKKENDFFVKEYVTQRLGMLGVFQSGSGWTSSARIHRMVSLKNTGRLHSRFLNVV